MEAFHRRLHSSRPVDKDASELSFALRVSELTQLTRAVWETLPDDVFPETSRRWTAEEQKKTHSRLLQLRTKMGKQAARESMTLSLGVEAEFVSLMESSGVFDASRSFATQARAFDPSLPDLSEFQAGRNAWAAFGLQLRSAEGCADCSSAITGYSLLYPYSDNLLDDPKRPKSYKAAFQRRFMSWLRGEPRDADNAPKDKDEEHVMVRNHVLFPSAFYLIPSQGLRWSR